jgi:polyisoprenyl-phosphate glycosyltransferase
MNMEPEVSVVIPLFSEEENLPELYRRTTAALKALKISYEIVLINDGSADGTASMLDDLARRDARVTAIHLSRNFGHQAAVSAGIDHARGQAVILMDGDLQDPPEVLGQFLDQWRHGYEVVYSVRTKRKEGFVKRTAYALFYRMLRATSSLNIPLDSGDFCLMDRKVVDALRLLPERQRFVRGLRTFVGFRQIGLRHERDARFAGKPKYTFRALLRLAMDGMVGFSDLPLTLVTYFGVFSFILALGLSGWVLVDALYQHTAPRGWASILAVILYMGSVQLLSLGIIAEYIRRIFLETKQRPFYIVARISKVGDRADAVQPPLQRVA